MATITPTTSVKGRSVKRSARQTVAKRATRHNGYNADSVAPSQAKPGETPAQFAGLWKRTRPNE